MISFSLHSGLHSTLFLCTFNSKNSSTASLSVHLLLALTLFLSQSFNQIMQYGLECICTRNWSSTKASEILWKLSRLHEWYDVFLIKLCTHLTGVLEIHLILLSPSCFLFFFFFPPENDVEVALNLYLFFSLNFQFYRYLIIIHCKIRKTKIIFINENLSKLSAACFSVSNYFKLWVLSSNWLGYVQ